MSHFHASLILRKKIFVEAAKGMQFKTSHEISFGVLANKGFYCGFNFGR